MFRSSRLFLITGTLLLSVASAANACDLCSFYNSVESNKAKAGSFKLGLSQQFTAMERVQANGSKAMNHFHQHLKSSQTQLFGFYDLNDTWSFRLSLPYINRRFKRVENETSVKGNEAGIGDATLLAFYTPWQSSDDGTYSNVQLFGGVKLPTGDSDRLTEDSHHHEEENGEHEEMEEEMPNEETGEHHHGMHSLLRHDNSDIHVMESVIHGHELALGSGSWDFPIGASFLTERGRHSFSGQLVYFLRTEGDHSYRFANDLRWEISTGYKICMQHDHSLALKLNLSGEYKGEDKVSGVEHGASSMNSTFVGPKLSLATSSGLSAELGWDFPVRRENSGTQLVPNYRLRAGVTYRWE